jgi:hypothetical protein
LRLRRRWRESKQQINVIRRSPVRFEGLPAALRIVFLAHCQIGQSGFRVAPDQK